MVARPPHARSGRSILLGCCLFLAVFLAMAAPEETAAQAPAGATPEAVQDAPETGRHPETYLDFALAGGLFMIPIGVCSLLWFSYFVERLGATRRSRVLPLPFILAVEELLEVSQLDLGKARSLCAAHPSAGARVLRAAVDSLDGPREDLEEAVNHTAQREIHRLRRNIRVFAVIAAVAPLLGLLGTVTGMIQAFREVAIEGLGSGEALAPGIYQALVTTAAGLLVAIPALLTYHWFMSRVDHHVRQLDDVVVEFVQRYRRQQGGSAATDGEGPGPGSAASREV
jgi:biopolymer transport protein ExbB